ncbi:MAG: PilN domain-containing protein [Candidatus Rokubacteria bacterium]|nr:PilN domain-containing protein [Candidatus Rokubacteria bacterium]
MTRPRVGLFLHEHALTVAAVTGRGRLEHFTLASEEDLASLLRAELATRHLRPRWMRIGLQRSLVTVKPLELPAAAESSLAEVLRFELERHVPFSPEEMVFDSLALPTTRGGPLRVLVAACERRAVERALRLLAEPRLKPLSVTVACHNLPALLGRRLEARRAVWAHRRGEATDLVFLGSGELRLSRTVPAADGDELAGEIAGSLRLLKWKDFEAVWVSGDAIGGLVSSPALAALGAPVSEPPYRAGVATLLETVPEGERGVTVLALAVALGPRQPVLNLLPEALRPRMLTGGQVVTAGVAALAAALGLGALLTQGHADRRYLEDLDRTTRALAPQVKVVEKIAAELNQKKRLLAAFKAVEESGIRALPVLRELTERLPPDAWLSTLTLDTKSIELAGQASAAGQLIPLLESSAWIERVEFTSPVTRGRDKEQFRIKAAWEAGPAGPRSAPRPQGQD